MYSISLLLDEIVPRLVMEQVINNLLLCARDTQQTSQPHVYAYRLYSHYLKWKTADYTNVGLCLIGGSVINLGIIVL